MNFNVHPLPPDVRLAGMAWIARASRVEAVTATLSEAMNVLGSRLAGDAWVIVGTDAWQSDSAVVRHHGLWGMLRSEGRPIARGQPTEQVVHKKDGKIKFFAATPFAAHSLEEIVDLLIAWHCVYVALLPHGRSVVPLLECGWSGEVQDETEHQLLRLISKNDTVLLKRVGSFDDIEWGVVALHSSKG